MNKKIEDASKKELAGIADGASESAVAEDDVRNMKNMRTKGLGRFFWILVAVAALLSLARLIANKGPSQKGDPDNLGNGVTVTPSGPSAQEVEGLRQKRKQELELQRLKLEADKLRADIDARYAKFKGDINAIVEKYHKMLPLSEAEDHFKAADGGAAFIASKDGLCGFKVCAVLAYKMAYDEIKGTHYAEDAIRPVVSNRIVEPLGKAVDVYARWTADFRNELQKEDQAFSLDLAIRSHKFNETISVLSVEKATNISHSVSLLVDDVRDHAKEAVLASASAVVELALIKSSYVAIRKLVVKIATTALAGVAKKMAGTAAAAVTSSAADGPLPFGEIVGGVITIGGLIWTAYDIYNVTARMPGEMENGIKSAIDKTREQLRDTGVQNLMHDKESCLESADARVSEIYELLK